MNSKNINVLDTSLVNNLEPLYSLVYTELSAERGTVNGSSITPHEGTDGVSLKESTAIPCQHKTLYKEGRRRG